MKTRVITVKAKEILEADITNISLVNRGANRAPIKIIKADEVDYMPMQIFKTDEEQKKETPIEVASVHIKKSNKTEDIKTLLRDQGFDFDVAVVQDQERDGESSQWLIYKQSDEGTEENGAIVEVSEDVRIQLTAKAADLSSISSSFGESLKKRSFFPGIGIAMDALYDVIVSKVTMPDDGVDSKGIEKAITDFSGYIMGLVNGLPAAVTKSEQVLKGTASADAHANAQAEEEQEETPAEETPAEAPAETPAESADETPSEGAEGENASEAEPEGAEEAETAPEASEQQESPPVEEVVKSAVEEALKGFKEEFAAVEEKLKKQNQTLLNEAVNNLKKTVVGNVGDTDSLKTKKEEEENPKQVFGNVLKFD